MLFHLLQRLGRSRAQHVGDGTVDECSRTPRRSGGASGFQVVGTRRENGVEHVPGTTLVQGMVWRDSAAMGQRACMRHPLDPGPAGFGFCRNGRKSTWRQLDHAASDADSQAQKSPVALAPAAACRCMGVRTSAPQEGMPGAHNHRRSTLPCASPPPRRPMVCTQDGD